ncbi:MAG: mycothione reductase [Brachybacterium sp.]|nr:mycothione reductase [Brachybacterium sp.]
MTHYDIALIGSGSGNSLPGPELQDRSIVYIDRGVGPDRVFGGTCLNMGCIPTKMFVHTAEVASAPREAPRLGLAQTLDGVDWPAIRDRIFAHIDPKSAAGLAYRTDHPDNANLTYIHGTARFRSAHELQVDLAHGGQKTITADSIVIAAGSRPQIPPIEGLEQCDPHTSDTIMRIDELPRSLMILGAGVIAAEMAHIFAALGVEVTILARGPRLLRHEDEDIARLVTEQLGERCTILTGVEFDSAHRTDAGVEITGRSAGEDLAVRADEVLVATGRRANTDLLDVAAAGIATRKDGTIRTDAYQRVLGEDGAVIEGLWALGDVADPHQLKHVANHQLRIVRHNLLHPEDLRRSDTMPLTYGIFTHPAVGVVGVTEAEARREAEQSGREIVVARQYYRDIAYGWALEDTTSFAKIVADAATGELLGAQVAGPQATTLVQLVTQAMSTGQKAQDIASTQYWIHPALTELIENALLQISPRDRD